MREAFVEQGLDVDAGTPAEAAARFGARGIPIELAAALDVWALVRRRLADEAGFARLARIADLLDGDETRSRVRLAIAERDAAALKTLAQRDDVLRLPVATLQILGSGLRGVGAVHEAAALLEPAHRRHPDDFLICLHLARALHEANERDASARYFMTAIALNPSSPVATSEAGQELYNVREYARAQAVYEAGLAAWPEDAVLHCQLAWALRAQGLTDRAEAESAESVRLAPRSPWVRASRGSMLTNRRPVDEAAIFAEFDEAMRLAPQSGLVIGWAAEACMELRKPDRAWELARKAIELDPTSPKLREIYGWIAAHNGHADEAVASAREAVRLGPGRFESHHSLAEALLGKYRLEEALAEAQTAVRLNPKVVNGHLLLACIWFELGWFERARACHERARELGGTAFGSGMLEFFQATERRAAAESRYLAILEGNLKARDVEEMVGASCAGAMRDWPLAAFRQMQAAFRADLAYVRDPKKYEPHFIGLTAAARAILGRGDAAKIGADERAELGEQALEWLRDMLEIRVAFESRERLCGLIEIWLTCSEVAGIRDEEGLAKLPPDLAARLRAAWQDVRARRDAAKR
jgi:tetratricopeptide (TPR) repeat protein